MKRYNMSKEQALQWCIDNLEEWPNVKSIDHLGNINWSIKPERSPEGWYWDKLPNMKTPCLFSKKLVGVIVTKYDYYDLKRR